MAGRGTPGTLLAALLVAALPLAGLAAAPLEPAGHGAPPEAGLRRNLADVDATTNPARVHGQLLDPALGDVVHLRIRTPGDGLYTLRDPDGLELATLAATGGVALFPDVPVAKSGTYTLLQGATEVTTFVVNPSVGLSDILAHHVVRGALDLLPVPTLAEFRLRNMTFRFDPVGAGQCLLWGTHDANVTFTIPPNEFRKIRFTDFWYFRTSVYGPGPTPHLSFELGGRDSAWPNVGNNIVWLKSLVVAPYPDIPYHHFDAYAFVRIQPGTSFDLHPEGTVLYEPLYAPNRCVATTDSRTVTVRAP